MTSLYLYTIHLADNALVLAQRNSEWCGHGPVLEQDIALTNISLDLLGQARNFYQYAASLYNGAGEDEKAALDLYIPHPWKGFGRALKEDDLAFLREERQFLNLLLAELPKGDWGKTILRQFFCSAFQFLAYSALQSSKDAQLAAIAEKSLKEVTYHLRWSGEWVIRLGDGTEESHRRMLAALEELWPFTGELFLPAAYEREAAEEGLGVNGETLRNAWLQQVEEVLTAATLPLLPPTGWMQRGGKLGRHTEHLGYLLAEMQYLQRAYPDSNW
ncbi:1,2-phenylacetyl-CoA epoxidase subunit PaaC [Paraflavisolibacter sp. H34]|uniref:1,2-phenylacetyl-CoA epoxidase subunit PaaC n=1 Tax=Huijunlia imazamoxiresistens TaxID=3127457 RepID=UPI003016F1A1